jgi:two-component system chemotaxis response regulator CheB
MNNEKQLTRRDVVVIAGSLGAMDALRQIMTGLPEDFPACVLIVLHSSSTGPSTVLDILQRYTRLGVRYATEGEKPKPGVIYLAVPDRHLELAPPGVMKLTDGPKIRYARPSADRLFETAATTFGGRVVSIILSGGDGHGADGARAIARAGGLTFVQDPFEAQAPSMPMYALEHDDPALCLKAAELGAALLEAVHGNTDAKRG